MTDDTYDSVNVGDVFAGGNPHTELAYVYTSETIYPGSGIYVDDTKDARAAAYGDKLFSGVAALKVGHDIDAVYSDDEQFEYYPAGMGAIVWVTLEATSPALTLRKGTQIAIGTEDGKFRVFAYANATDTSDSSINICGRGMNYDAGSVTNDHKVKMVLAL